MTIKPLNKIEGEFTVPGDKSITHRAVMLGAAASGTSVITGALLGQDCLSTIDCMRQLGSEIDISGNTVTVKGVEKFKDNTFLYCGNSGTTIRLLTGLLSGQNISCILTGDSSLTKRPMKRVSEPLARLGANIITVGGFPPIRVYPAQLNGAEIIMDTPSAQVKSAILLAGINADGETTVCEKGVLRNHTELMLKAMGADISTAKNKITVKKSLLSAVDTVVPADISSAAYFMALGGLLGEVTVKNAGINPTRSGILKVFNKMGIRYELSNKKTINFEQTADITVYRSDIKAVKLGKGIIAEVIDELPIIAVLMSMANGVSEVCGAGELRVKESDRIKSITAMIKSCGGLVEEREDGFVIEGKQKLSGGRVNSFGDHRIALSGAVLLAASYKGGSITDAECADVSFPDFYRLAGLES